MIEYTRAPMQLLSDAGINPWAAQMLAESYARSALFNSCGSQMRGEPCAFVVPVSDNAGGVREIFIRLDMQEPPP